MVSAGLTRCRTLDIENDRSSRIDLCGRDKSAGLDQHFIAAIAQLRDEREDAFLGKRFAARYFDKLASKFIQPSKYLVKGNVLAAVKRVFAVTPGTSHRAAGKPHKRAWPASMR